jgi:hypothetical protein
MGKFIYLLQQRLMSQMHAIERADCNSRWLWKTNGVVVVY